MCCVCVRFFFVTLLILFVFLSSIAKEMIMHLKMMSRFPFQLLKVLNTQNSNMETILTCTKTINMAKHRSIKYRLSPSRDFTLLVYPGKIVWSNFSFLFGIWAILLEHDEIVSFQIFTTDVRNLWLKIIITKWGVCLYLLSVLCSRI